MTSGEVGGFLIKQPHACAQYGLALDLQVEMQRRARSQQERQHADMSL